MKTLMKKPKDVLKYLFRISSRIVISISPRLGSKYIFRVVQGKRLNLKSPVTFNGKIQWLKLNNYNSNELATKCSDKYSVREYVIERGLEHILVDLLSVHEKPEDINWRELPNEFVIKTTHGCGSNIICTNKSALDIESAINELNHWLALDYGKFSGEKHYSKIQPKIIIEKYISSLIGKLPVDYKVYCFNGKAKLILVISDRDEDIKLDFLTLDWSRLNIGQKYFESQALPKRPKVLDKMVEYAEILAEPFPFVRVDFYDGEDEPIFGEMTFTPASGVATYYTEQGDEYLGGLLEI